MNCLNLAAMNGQQAPTGRPTVSARQSVRLDPTHTASIRMNLIAGQIRAARIKALSSVAIELRTLPNSFCCSQAGVPTIERGGATGAISCWRTKVALIPASRPLGQPHTGIIEIHREARDQRDREIDRHGD